MSVLPVANDKVQLTSSAGTNYQNGVLMSGASAVYATSSPSVWSNGIYRTADGAIYVFNATAGMPSGFTWSNGLPFSALGALCVSTNAVASWSNGIPFDANGAVVADFGMPVPALSLNFTSGTLDSRITFTRASGATYTNSSGVLQLATSNTPRFDYDPVTLSAKGLLIEEQRTNLLTYSEQFDNAAWVKGGSCVVSANSVAAPDGTLTADTITSTGSTASDNQAISLITFSVVSGSVFSFSVWLKATTPTTTTIRISNLGDGDGSSSIVNVTTSWQRFTVTHTFTGVSTSVRAAINYQTSATTVYAWGAQLEAGSFATSYIPTTTAQATRAADVAVMTGTNFSSWYNQSEGTLYAEYDINSSTTAPNNETAIATDDGTSANRHELRRTTSGYTSIVFVAGSTSYVNMADNAPILAGSTTRKSSYSYKVNDVAFTSNGLTVVTDTTVTLPTVTTFRIGSSIANGPLNGHIKALAYYNTRLSNAQLQTLTT